MDTLFRLILCLEVFVCQIVMRQVNVLNSDGCGSVTVLYLQFG